MQEFTLSLKNFCAGIASDSAKREHLSCEALLNMYVTPAGKLKHVNWIGILDLNAILSTINAVSDNIQMSYLDTYSGNVLGNDAGTDLVVTAVDGNPLLVDAWIEETDGTLLRISSDGTISIDAEEINSVTTTFTHSYTITNAVGSDIGTVNVQLSSVLSPVSDSVSTDDATIITGNVLDNDTGVGMYVNAVDGLLANIGVAQTLTNGTVVTINSDGSYTVDPTGCDTSGGDVVDTIEYTASNGSAEASAQLVVTVISADVVLWTPDLISGALVFDALDADNITLNGAYVSAWADMFGVGVQFTAATASAQPTMGTGELLFDGDDALTAVGSKSAAWTKAFHSTGGTVIALVQLGESSNPNAAYALCGTTSGSSGSVGMLLYFDDRASVPRDNALNCYVARGVATQPAVEQTALNSIIPGQYNIVDFLIDPDNSNALERCRESINGDTDIQLNAMAYPPSLADSVADMQIGAGNGAIPLVGRKKCIAFVPYVLDTADRAKLVGWMAHRHNRTDLLAADHAYKLQPPTV